MPYLEPLPEWQAPGIEPPEQRKEEGWRYLQRPPASYFDWLQFTTYYALKELQENALHSEKLYSGIDKDDALLVATAKAVKLAYDKAIAVEAKLTNTVDVAPSALNTLKKLATAIDNDAAFATTIRTLITSKETSTKSYTDTKIAELVNSSPSTLDTLKEIADALGNDPNFATSITTMIGTKETPTGSQEKATAALNAAKTYADDKATSLLSSVPTQLDTLAKIATAINNDPSFHTTISNLINAKISSSDKGVVNGVATLGTDSKIPVAQLPDGSLSQKGAVQLSSSTTSNFETTAATSKAVKDIKDAIPILNNTVTSTSATEAATANAVKIAMDRADQAFLQANDIKTKWAGVVGSPLLSSDTSIQLQTKTQSIKDSIVTKLTSKSITATGTETMTQLVNKLIALIP